MNKRNLIFLLAIVSCTEDTLYPVRPESNEVVARIEDTFYNPDLYVIEGQSNAAGVGKTCPVVKIDSVNIFVAKRLTWESFECGVNSRGTTGVGVDNLEGFYGVETSLMKSLVQATSRPQYLIKWAMVATPLDKNTKLMDWSPASVSECFARSNAAYTSAIDKLEDKRPPKAYIWIQGESDCEKIQIASNYKSNLEKFIRMKREYYKYPAMPVIIVTLSDSQTRIKPNLKAIVKQAQIEVGSQPNNYLVNTDSLTTFDGIHYTEESLNKLGLAIFEIVNDL